MKNRFIIALWFSMALSLWAQPDEAYISKLIGNVNHIDFDQLEENLKSEVLSWQSVTVPDFEKIADNTRKKALLSGEWMFYPQDTMYHIKSAQEVQIPHRFEKNRTYNSGWYVQKINLDKESGKSYHLMLDRVELFSMVFVNGHRCMHHFGSYTPFSCDISIYLTTGENTIAIFVYDQTATIDNGKLYNQIGVTRVKHDYGQFKLKGGMYGIPTIEMREASYLKDVFVKTSTRKNELEIEYEFPEGIEILPNAEVTFELFQWPEGDKVELELPSKKLTSSLQEKMIRIDQAENSYSVKWPDAQWWSPEHPNLYVLRTTFDNGTSKDVVDTRFGFREFWIEGKMFYLNGTPIRLRGNSIYNPKIPGRDFHRENFIKHKELFGVNACRIHHTIPPIDLLYAADEAGILLDNQSSIWSEMAPMYKDGGDWFLANTEIEFEEWVRRDRNCPSVVIWDLENEMLRVSFEEHLPWVEKLPEYVWRLDQTRPLNHSGAGWFSPYQHMAWLHMQEQYCKIMLDWQEKGDIPLVIGEFWIGGRADFGRIPHSPELTQPNQKNIERAISYSEKMLEMRYHGVSGIMPFKLFTYVKVTSPPQEQEIIRKAIQSSVVFYWPRQRYTQAAQSIHREIVVCNDSEAAQDYTLHWHWEGKPQNIVQMRLPAAAQQRISIESLAPQSTSKLIATLTSEGAFVSSDTLLIETLPEPSFDKPLELLVYNSPSLVETLQEHGIKASSSDAVPSVNQYPIWLIPENADNRALYAIKDHIYNYVNSGGRILCLKQSQEAKWLPVKLPFWSAYQAGIHTYALMGWEGLNTDLFYANEARIYAASHPIFEGINSKTLHLWDDVDGRISDHVYTRPSSINRFEPGNWRPLSGGSRRSHISLSELFYGKGDILLCQLNLMDNLSNPQAELLFSNIINYLNDFSSTTADKGIVLSGELDKAEFKEYLALPQGAIRDTNLEKGGVLLAGENADNEQIQKWLEDGGLLIVLSGTKASNLSNTTYHNAPIEHIGKMADSPIAYGVCSANSPNKRVNIFKGYFTNLPEDAHELLRGFQDEQHFGAVMFSQKRGKGEIVYTTLDSASIKTSYGKELLNLLLTNAGIIIPYKATYLPTVEVKRTVPVTIDGNLEEWIEDMEDRWVTKFIHAQPIYLTSECIIEGPPEFDLNLSAINYMMWNEQGLCVAGVVFSEERTWESGVTWGSEKEYDLDLMLNDDRVKIIFKDGKLEAVVNEQVQGLQCQAGQISSEELTDASALQFDYIFKSGEIKRVPSLIGDTYELCIPWDLLNTSIENEEWKALWTISAKGSKLQFPLSAKPDSQNRWLKMYPSNKGK